MNKVISLITLLLLMAIKAGCTTLANDSIRMSLPEIENLFIQRNLLLLASKYNIEASKAEIIQSRLWPNPVVYLEQNIYNQYTKKAFDASKKGQNIVQVSQLIELAGKRNKRIRMAQLDAKIAEFQFYDLLRSLRFELRSTFFNAYYQFQTLAMYDEEIASLRRTLEIFEILIKKGVIAQKEIIRLKALLFNLESERLDVTRQLIDNHATLNLMLNQDSSVFIIPVVDSNVLDSLKPVLSLKQLVDTAQANRQDLRIQEYGRKMEELNLAYQKSLRIPDMRMGFVYDKAGSYIPNYTGLSVSIDLPVLNRNQGNIGIAKSRIDQGKMLVEHQQNIVFAEVNEAFEKLQEILKTSNLIDDNISSDFNGLIDIIIKNYEKRNISLIEFLDYYQAYKTSMVQLNKLKNDKVQAIEQLNFSVGKSVIRF